MARIVDTCLNSALAVFVAWMAWRIGTVAIPADPLAALLRWAGL